MSNTFGFARYLTLGLAHSLALIGLVAASAPSAASPKDFNAFVFSTGSPGGIYSPLGRSICHLFNRDRPEDLPTCLALNSSGSVENIRALQSGDASIALVQSDVAYWAVSGQGPFQDALPMSDLTVVFAGHTEAVTVLARPGIQIDQTTDLLRHRVTITGPGTGTTATAEAILDALGWSRLDFASFGEAPLNDQLAGLCDETTDIAITVVGHPSGFVRRAIEQCGAHLVALSDPTVIRAVDTLPFVHMGTIPGGAYPDQDADLTVPSLRSLVVAGPEADNGVIGHLSSTISEHISILRRLHPAFADMDLKIPEEDLRFITLHPSVSAR